MLSSRFTSRFLPRLTSSSSRTLISVSKTSTSRSSSYPLRSFASSFSSSSSSFSPSPVPPSSSSTSPSSPPPPPSSPAANTANNVGNYAANEIPLSTTSNPEPNRAPNAFSFSSSSSPSSSPSSSSSSPSSPPSSSSSTIKVSETLKDAYSGLKDRVSQVKEEISHTNASASSSFSGLKDRVVQGAEKMKEGVMQTTQSIREEGHKVMEKGKEKIMKVKDAASHRVEEMEQRFEEKGLGPVTGVERSVAETQTPSHIGATSDAAVGKVEMKTETESLTTPKVEVESIDSYASLSGSGSSFPTSSPPSPPTERREVRSANAGPTAAREREGEDAPQYGVAESQQGRKEGDALSSATLRPVDSSKEASGVEGSASAHAAESQRQEGMTSSELLGSQAIPKEAGRNKMEEKARPPRPAETVKEQRGSRPRQ